MNKHHQHPLQPRGFTLIELMIAMALVSLLSIGMMAFMVDVGRGIFWGTEKAEISQDVRSFTMRLAAEARSSNSAYIYPSFAAADRDAGSDRRDEPLSGDCLVLATTQPYPDTDDDEHYINIVVYFRKGNEADDGVGPVYRLEWDAASESDYINASENTLESVLKKIDDDDNGNYPVVIELSRGVSNGHLFTNFNQGKVIVVNGEILHGNKVKEVTNTYNLSISPRG